MIGKDASTDLALLKLDAQDLPVIEWAAADPPVGSWLATPGLGKAPLAIGVVSVAPRRIRGAALGISLGESNDVARIMAVQRNSAAENAGLKAGDIIRQVDSKVIKGQQALRDAIAAYQKGDKVELLIERNGSQMKIEATLGSMTQLMLGERAGFQNGLGGKLSNRRESFPASIQHDTVLSPNQCGGPLVDLDGKAVGLNIARAGRVESYALTAAVAQEAIAKLLAQAPAPANSKLVDKTEGVKKIQ
jgi:serine protease Do